MRRGIPSIAPSCAPRIRTLPTCCSRPSHRSLSALPQRTPTDLPFASPSSDPFSPSRLLKRPNIASPLTRYNAELAKAVIAKDVIGGFKICKRIKELNLRPDVETYNYLMRLLASANQHEAAFALLTDMDAAGVAPDIETYNQLVASSRTANLNTQALIDRMESEGVERNPVTYQHIISHHFTLGNLEMCLQVLDEMHLAGLRPTLVTAEQIINLATRLDYARLALDIAISYEESSFRRLPVASWMQILISSTGIYYLDGVEFCWNKAVVENKASPDEGLCIEVLHVAGRFGKPALGSDVVRVMKQCGMQVREHHLAPLLEAFCRAEQLREALGVLSLMRSTAIVPSEETTQPVFTYIAQRIEEVDKAFYILEDFVKEGKPIDISAVNAIIHASVVLSDLQRGVGTYKECERLKVTPNRETYHYLLQACVAAKHAALAEKIFGEMKAASIPPDAAALERMVDVHLTQTSYDTAFYYLEELKEKTKLVPARVYEAIIRKCVVSYDPRWKLAADEMEAQGHQLSSRLLRFIDTGRDDEPGAVVQEEQEKGEEEGRAQEWNVVGHDVYLKERRSKFVKGVA